jgi:hypothetical protein
MFKFGLIKEALTDFDRIIAVHPKKEIWSYFNRAICLIQLEEVVVLDSTQPS